MNRIIGSLVWVGLYWLVLGGSGYAQSRRISAYTLADGLPQSQVYDIVQDPLGYLWMGTQGGGICSFDGERFRVWNERDGLISNYIHAITWSADSLFVGTRQGLSIKTQGGFTNIPGPQINRIFAGTETTYLATQSGVYIYRGGHSLTKLTLHPLLDQARINDVGFRDGQFWIASNKGLWKTQTLEGPLGEAVSNQDVKSIEFYQDKVIVATFDAGVWVYEEGNLQKPKTSQPRRINHITLLNENQLWVSTDNDGIWVLNADDRSVIQRLSAASGLSVFHIRKCLKDRQGNIWIASSGGGLYKYAQTNFNHYDTDSGLKGNRVYAVHRDGDKIWASNSEAGLVKIDSLGIHEATNDPRMLNVKIKTLASDEQGNIWAGSEGKGIFVVGTQMRDSIVVDTLVTPARRDTFRIDTPFTHVLNPVSGFPSNWVRKILIDPPYIWAATYSSGMIRFRYAVEKDSIYDLVQFGMAEGMERILVNDMRRDSLGRLWYGTRKGHLGYIQGGQVEHLGNILGHNIDITSLRFHAEKLFVGTAGRGIWWSDLADSIRFEPLTGNKALYSDNIYQLIFDEEGNLWAGSESGVDQIVLNESAQMVEVFHYGRNDGFLGIETCLNAVTKDEKGNLWFGTIYGLTQFQAREKTITNTQPVLEFEDIEVVYQSLDTIDVNDWGRDNRILQLAPRQNHLAFRYRTIDINHPAGVEYRWRLNEAEWSPWAEENSINFAGLTHGDFRFEAQSRNIDWIESEVITFRFHITQPLYEKAWFQQLLIALMALFVMAMGAVYLRRIKRKNAKEQERLQLENHLLSLEQKALRLQMNPHFVFNVLNEIKAMGIQDPEKMNTTINKFASLLRATLNNSREDNISLDQEIQTLRNYIEVEQLMIEKEFSYEIVLSEEIDPEEVLIPPMLIQPFVENAIRHGIMAVKRPGKLRIGFGISGAWLRCSVSDNGIGIHESQKNKTATNHQSLALEVTRERIESLAGANTLEIKEVVTSTQQGGGTQVEFRIPLLTDY